MIKTGLSVNLGQQKRDFTPVVLLLKSRVDELLLIELEESWNTNKVVLDLKIYEIVT